MVTLKYSGARFSRFWKELRPLEKSHLGRESRQDSGASVNFTDETYINEFLSLNTKLEMTQVERAIVMEVREPSSIRYRGM